MPTKLVYKNGHPIGYRWGKSGKLYLTSKYGLKALALANRQGQAIYSSGYTMVKKHSRKGRKVISHKRRVKRNYG